MNRTSRLSWRRSVSLAVLIAGSVCWVAFAQQSARAPQGSPAGNPSTFTGRRDVLDSKNIRSSRSEYEPGARSFWHVHEGWQITLMEQGRGRTQLQGGKVIELLPGQPFFLPPGVPHWHGAAPDERAVQVAVSIDLPVKWLKPVTDQEYRAYTPQR